MITAWSCGQSQVGGAPGGTLKTPFKKSHTVIGLAPGTFLITPEGKRQNLFPGNTVPDPLAWYPLGHEHLRRGGADPPPSIWKKFQFPDKKPVECGTVGAGVWEVSCTPRANPETSSTGIGAGTHAWVRPPAGAARNGHPWHGSSGGVLGCPLSGMFAFGCPLAALGSGGWCFTAPVALIFVSGKKGLSHAGYSVTPNANDGLICTFL